MPTTPERPIAICMATYEPDPRLFAAQIDSIRSQTVSGWTCFISDDHSGEKATLMIRSVLAGDDRFVLSRSPQRLGFYRNFERALGMVPSGTALVALSDQDDLWHPDKLGSLASGIGESTLAYSDMRLTSPEGEELAPTFWRGRRNEYCNLASVIVANTITGSASLFRRELLDLALPFPDNPGWQFHDHWLAICALATGDVAYVDRPLYDYVQHPGAILGQVSGSGQANRFRQWIGDWTGYSTTWRAGYYYDVLRLQSLASVLLARADSVGTGVSAGKASTLRRFAEAERSLRTLVWLSVRPLRRLAGRNETLGSESNLTRGLLWRRTVGLRAKLRIPVAETGPPPGDPADYGPRGIRRWRAGQSGTGA